MTVRCFKAVLALCLIGLPISHAAAEDAAEKCAALIKGLGIKSGTDYDGVMARLKAKGWHQTFTTTQNVGSWTKRGQAISVTLNLGSGTTATTAGAVHCRN